jgi:hypothetical protein
MNKKFNVKEFEYHLNNICNLLIDFSKDQIHFNKSYTKKQKELLFNLFDDFLNDRIKESYKQVEDNVIKYERTKF